MAIYDMFVRKPTPPTGTATAAATTAATTTTTTTLATEKGKKLEPPTKCDICGEPYPQSVVGGDAQKRIGDLESQVKILTEKASAAGKFCLFQTDPGSGGRTFGFARLQRGGRDWAVGSWTGAGETVTRFAVPTVWTSSPSTFPMDGERKRDGRDPPQGVENGDQLLPTVIRRNPSSIFPPRHPSPAHCIPQTPPDHDNPLGLGSRTHSPAPQKHGRRDALA